MESLSLDAILWHDLPITRISFSENGFELIATPFDECAKQYKNYVLSIEQSTASNIEMVGSISSLDWGNMEVARFEYAFDQAGRISGTIGILPGEGGYWNFEFANAVWSLSPK